MVEPVFGSLELEIHQLLIQLGSLDLVADALIKKYEERRLKLEEFETLSQFLLNAGFSATLAEFITRKLADKSQIPWGHYAEALFRCSPTIEEEVRRALIEGAGERRALIHLSRCHELDGLDSEIPQQRELRKKSHLERRQLLRDELLSQLETMRSQGLFQEEERLIDKLFRLDPQDSHVLQLQAELKERMALEFISRRAPILKREKEMFLFEPLDPEAEKFFAHIAQAMERELEKSPELAKDFAVAFWFWEKPDLALSLLEKAEPTNATLWFKAELLLKARRFLDTLELIKDLEKNVAEDPDLTFAITYLRAQAFWGLEQKYAAIELLESLLHVQPDYRMAASTLLLWKGDLG